MENNKLEERLNRLEHKMDVIFDQLIGIKTALKREMIKKNLEECKEKSRKTEEEIKYMEMDLDSIWQDNERLQKEYRYEYYGDCEEVNIRS